MDAPQREVMEAAAAVMRAKQSVVALDRRQHQLREATREIRRRYGDDDSWANAPMTYLVAGETFVETTVGRAKQALARDATRTQAERAAAEAELKKAVLALAKVEGPDGLNLAAQLAGFDLKPQGTK